MPAYLKDSTVRPSMAVGDYLYFGSTANGDDDSKILKSNLFTNAALITPDIGAATGASLVLSGAASAATFNKVTVTAPASGSTLTIDNGKTARFKHSITFEGTDGTTMTFPTGTAIIARIDSNQTFYGDQTFAVIINETLRASAAITSSGPTAGIGYATGAGGTATEVAGAVTLDKVSGTLTTSSLTNAAAGEYVITVTNATVAATDVPVVGIKAYAGAGTPIAVVTAVATGSFTITITNLHSATALNAVATLNFIVFKGVDA